MILPCSLTDRKDESRFRERFRLSECSRFSSLDPCLWCLLLFVYDALLRSARKAALAAITESVLFRISLFLFPVILIAFAGRNDTLRVHSSLHLLV
jgi:hypothetical protein